jgi:YVTN family beta-propeller protein
MGVIRRLAAMAAVALALGACQAAGPSAVAGPRPGEGRLVLYLNGPPSAPLPISFDLASIEAVTEEGARLPVRPSPIKIDSLEVVGRQILLAEAFLPAGRYRTMALGVARTRARQEGRWQDLSTPADGFTVDAAFEIRAGEPTVLFMTWDADRSIEADTAFRATFGFEGRGREPRTVLGFVTNEGSDTVSVIDRSVDRVVDVLGAGRGPRGVAVTADTTRAFVVNQASQTLTVIDVPNGRVFHTTNLEGGSAPSDIAITADGRALYVTNTAIGSVTAIDARSFQTLRTIPVGLRPSAVTAVPSRRLVVVANGGSNTLSVIDASDPFNPRLLATTPVDFQPAHLAADAAGALLFVPHLGSPRLAVVSLSSLRTVKSVTVGVASAALPDGEGSTGRVFVARVREGRVSLYDTALGADLGSTPVGDEPRYLALDPDREKLYVVDRGSDTVTVVDRFSRRVRGTIHVGKRPYAIALVP